MDIRESKYENVNWIEVIQERIQWGGGTRDHSDETSGSTARTGTFLNRTGITLPSRFTSSICEKRRKILDCILIRHLIW